MTISNKLTVFRIVLTPLILFCLINKSISGRYIYALLIFILASYTDYLDGRLARKNNTISNFGKIMDPLADKILITSILIYFAAQNIVPALAVILIIIREFMVTSIRLLILEKTGKIVSANLWGKFKTIGQIAAIITVFIIQAYIELSAASSNITPGAYTAMLLTSNILIWIAAVLSVWSGIVYVYSGLRTIGED